MLRRSHIACLLLFILPSCTIAGTGRLRSPYPTGDVLEQVWMREVDSWAAARAGNVDAYVAFFHPDFIGWPCTYPRPATKETIGEWVRRIRDEKSEFTYEMRREKIQAFGPDLVGVLYSTPITITYSDGRKAGLPGRYKITHVWRRVNGTWLAISGMCGLPEEQIR